MVSDNERSQNKYEPEAYREALDQLLQRQLLTYAKIVNVKYIKGESVSTIQEHIYNEYNTLCRKDRKIMRDLLDGELERQEGKTRKNPKKKRENTTRQSRARTTHISSSIREVDREIKDLAEKFTRQVLIKIQPLL